MSWTRPASGGRPPSLPKLPELSRVAPVLDEAQYKAWRSAERAIARAAEQRQRQAGAVAQLDRARMADRDAARAAARAGAHGPGPQREREAREVIDAVRLDAQAAAAVAAERLAELERAVTGDQRGIAERAVTRLHEAVEAGAGWVEVLDRAEVVWWARDLDERPSMARHPERGSFETAAALLSDGPAQVAAEAVEAVRWLTDPTPEADQPQPAPATMIARPGSTFVAR